MFTTGRGSGRPSFLRGSVGISTDFRRESHRTLNPFAYPWQQDSSETLRLPIRVLRPTFQTGALPNLEPEVSPHTEPEHPPEVKPEHPPEDETGRPPGSLSSEGPRLFHH